MARSIFNESKIFLSVRMPKTGKVCVFYYYSSELHAAAAVDESSIYSAQSESKKACEYDK